MNLILETGEYYSQSSNQLIYYRERVEGMSVVKAAGNWFYNHETDRFISTAKFLQKLEQDEQINNANKPNLAE
jgi:hypothetical protein